MDFPLVRCRARVVSCRRFPSIRFDRRRPFIHLQTLAVFSINIHLHICVRQRVSNEREEQLPQLALFFFVWF